MNQDGTPMRVAGARDSSRATAQHRYILVIQAASLRDYEDVTRRLFFSQKNIRNFRTRMVMDEVKAGLEVLVREPA